MASACGLQRGASGPDFEKNLGLLLQWQKDYPLYRRFYTLGGDQPGSYTSDMEKAVHNTEKWLNSVAEALNETLYKEFGQARIDQNRAADAYQSLLKVLGEPELMIATTNYDRSVEAALRVIKRRVSTGFQSTGETRPTLEPQTLLADGLVPVIHLHGAVGWYETQGRVYEHFGDSPFNPTLGTPVVLYPDPDKDPTRDPIVSDLWTAFRQALDRADHVVVLGHSLNDPPLTTALNEARPGVKIAATYLNAGDDVAIRDKLPAATPIQLEFGPDPIWGDAGLERWLKSTVAV